MPEVLENPDSAPEKESVKVTQIMHLRRAETQDHELERPAYVCKQHVQ